LQGREPGQAGKGAPPSSGSAESSRKKYPFKPTSAGSWQGTTAFPTAKPEGRGGGLLCRTALRPNVWREGFKGVCNKGSSSPSASPMERPCVTVVRRGARTYKRPKGYSPHPKHSHYFHQMAEGSLKSLIYVCCLLLPRLSRARSSQLKMQSSRQSPGKLMKKPQGCFPPCLSQRHAEMWTRAQPGQPPQAWTEHPRSQRKRKIKHEVIWIRTWRLLPAGAMCSLCLGASDTPNQALKQSSPGAQVLAVASGFPSAAGKMIWANKKKIQDLAEPMRSKTKVHLFEGREYPA